LRPWLLTVAPAGLQNAGMTFLALNKLDGITLNVQLTRERSPELALAAGDDIDVSPKDCTTFRDFLCRDR
jgi:hypothetical protein